MMILTQLIFFMFIYYSYDNVLNGIKQIWLAISLESIEGRNIHEELIVYMGNLDTNKDELISVK